MNQFTIKGRASRGLKRVKHLREGKHLREALRKRELPRERDLRKEKTKGVTTHGNRVVRN